VHDVCVASPIGLCDMLFDHLARGWRRFSRAPEDSFTAHTSIPLTTDFVDSLLTWPRQPALAGPPHPRSFVATLHTWLLRLVLDSNTNPNTNTNTTLPTSHRTGRSELPFPNPLAVRGPAGTPGMRRWRGDNSASSSSWEEESDDESGVTSPCVTLTRAAFVKALTATTPPQPPKGDARHGGRKDAPVVDAASLLRCLVHIQTTLRDVTLGIRSWELRSADICVHHQQALAARDRSADGVTSAGFHNRHGHGRRHHGQGHCDQPQQGGGGNVGHHTPDKPSVTSASRLAFRTPSRPFVATQAAALKRERRATAASIVAVQPADPLATSVAGRVVAQDLGWLLMHDARFRARIQSYDLSGRRLVVAALGARAPESVVRDMLSPSPPQSRRLRRHARRARRRRSRREQRRLRGLTRTARGHGDDEGEGEGGVGGSSGDGSGDGLGSGSGDRRPHEYGDELGEGETGAGRGALPVVTDEEQAAARAAWGVGSVTADVAVGTLACRDVPTPGKGGGTVDGGSGTRSAAAAPPSESVAQTSSASIPATPSTPTQLGPASKTTPPFTDLVMASPLALEDHVNSPLLIVPRRAAPRRRSVASSDSATTTSRNPTRGSHDSASELVPPPMTPPPSTTLAQAQAQAQVGALTPPKTQTTSDVVAFSPLLLSSPSSASAADPTVSTPSNRPVATGAVSHLLTTPASGVAHHTNSHTNNVPSGGVPCSPSQSHSRSRRRTHRRHRGRGRRSRRRLGATDTHRQRYSAARKKHSARIGQRRRVDGSAQSSRVQGQVMGETASGTHTDRLAPPGGIPSPLSSRATPHTGPSWHTLAMLSARRSQWIHPRQQLVSPGPEAFKAGSSSGSASSSSTSACESVSDSASDSDKPSRHRDSTSANDGRVGAESHSGRLSSRSTTGMARVEYAHTSGTAAVVGPGVGSGDGSAVGSPPVTGTACDVTSVHATVVPPSQDNRRNQRCSSPGVATAAGSRSQHPHEPACKASDVDSCPPSPPPLAGDGSTATTRVISPACASEGTTKANQMASTMDEQAALLSQVAIDIPDRASESSPVTTRTVASASPTTAVLQTTPASPTPSPTRLLESPHEPAFSSAGEDIQPAPRTRSIQQRTGGPTCAVPPARQTHVVQVAQPGDASDVAVEADATRSVANCDVQPCSAGSRVVGACAVDTTSAGVAGQGNSTRASTPPALVSTACQATLCGPGSTHATTATPTERSSTTSSRPRMLQSITNLPASMIPRRRKTVAKARATSGANKRSSTTTSTRKATLDLQRQPSRCDVGTSPIPRPPSESHKAATTQASQPATTTNAGTSTTPTLTASQHAHRGTVRGAIHATPDTPATVDTPTTSTTATPVSYVGIDHRPAPQRLQEAHVRPLFSPALPFVAPRVPEPGAASTPSPAMTFRHQEHRPALAKVSALAKTLAKTLRRHPSNGAPPSLPTLNAEATGVIKAHAPQRQQLSDADAATAAALTSAKLRATTPTRPLEPTSISVPPSPLTRFNRAAGIVAAALPPHATHAAAPHSPEPLLDVQKAAAASPLARATRAIGLVTSTPLLPLRRAERQEETAGVTVHVRGHDHGHGQGQGHGQGHGQGARRPHARARAHQPRPGKTLVQSPGLRVGSSARRFYDGGPTELGLELGLGLGLGLAPGVQGALHNSSPPGDRGARRLERAPVDFGSPMSLSHPSFSNDGSERSETDEEDVEASYASASFQQLRRRLVMTDDTPPQQQRAR